MSTKSDVWAQLVSTTENDSEPIEIKKNKFIIGRSKAADLCLLGNKLVSGSHCYIERDETTGKVWLQDTSTNGTLINLTQKVVGIRQELKHGDEVYVVYRKADPGLNVAYLFQDMESLRKEEEEEEESSENTQLYSVTDEMETTAENSDAIERADSHSKRKQKALDMSNESDMPCLKKQKMTENPCKGDEKVKEADKGSTVIVSPEGDCKADEVDAFEESLICIICQELLYKCVSCQPCMHSFCAGCYSDWMTRSHECPSCRGTVERVNKNYIINNLVDAYLSKHPEKQRPEDELKALDERTKINKDSMKPPKLTKTLSEVIDEDGDEDAEEDELSASDLEEDDDDDNEDGGVAPLVHTNFGFPLIMYKPPKTVCRQCPEYKEPIATATAAMTAATGLVSGVINKVTGLFKGSASPGGSTEPADGTDAGEGPSTSTGAGDGAAPRAPPYKCTAAQVHILCQCCLQPMPDRRTASYTDKTVPQQQCAMCYRLFCHRYWGCRKAGCLGCIAKFKELEFGPKMFNNLILDNNYESDIFKNYIESNGQNINDVLQHCLGQLDQGEFTCMDNARGLTSDTVVCFGCAKRNLQDLAYQYRKSIPAEDLPAAVSTRPDCYWGKNCRTQRGKVHHAAKFNHICDQTR